MKIAFVFVALLVCANMDFRAARQFGNQIPGETEGGKIEVRASDESTKSDGSDCQDPNHYKPSAHIEAVNKGGVTYQVNTVIKDWSASAPNSHLAGGMKYHDGKLTVPTSGRYYIYAQLYYHKDGRVNVRVNNNVITMLHTPATHGTLNTGGVFNLKAGDVITLNIGFSIKIYMWSYHSYFGAFLI